MKIISCDLINFTNHVDKQGGWRSTSWLDRSFFFPCLKNRSELKVFLNKMRSDRGLAAFAKEWSK